MSYITYKQADSRWGRKNYNGSSSMATAGCGPTSCAMIAYGIDGKTTPIDTMKYMQKHGYAIRNNGTAWGGIPACLKAFGLTDVQSVPNMAKCWELMKKGYVGVFLFRKGSKGGITWTTSGHYVAVTDYKYKSNKHYIYTRDSGGRNHTGWYCYETQMKGLIPQIWLGLNPMDKPLTKPTTKYTGDIPTPTLKKGSKGKEVEKLQRFLNWYAKANMKVDGIFGSGTELWTRRFQKTEKISPDGVFGKTSQKYANNYKAVISSPSPVAPNIKSKYTGAFPDLIIHSGQKIAYTGIALAYPKGTAKSKYTYGKGKATPAFTAAINKVYPKRSSWSKQCQAGASCDVGAGTVIRYSGVDTSIPRGLQEQIPYLKKSMRFKKTDLTKTSQMHAGDIGVYIGKSKGAHIWIGIGNKQIVEANHTAKYFLHVDADNYTNANKKTWGIYRADVASPIKKGDKGTEVTKLQKFLIWYGIPIKADGDFGTLTEAAVETFQSKEGLKVDGIFGGGSLTVARTVTR